MISFSQSIGLFRRQRLKICVGLASGACLGVLAWYFSPASIERMNRLNYCACGYSEVRFERGRILMVKAIHDDPAPGSDIGGYSESGSEWDIEIRFEGKTRHERMKLDHIGVVAPSGTKRKYYAFDDHSAKIRVYYILFRLGLVNDYT